MNNKVSRNFEVTWVKSSKADAEFWMKWDFKPNRYPYYKYMLFCVDEDDLNLICRFKEGFGPPE